MDDRVISQNENQTPEPRILLIVDDYKQVARMAKRCLAPNFDNVLIATSPGEATRILQSTYVSHILCDLNLDPDDEDQQTGFVCSAQWRAAFPELKRIVIFTGSDIGDITVPLCIDRIVSKDASMDRIVEALLDDVQTRDPF